MIKIVVPAAVAVLMWTATAAQSPFARPMSFHNRLLLNRAVVNGFSTIEVMVLAKNGRLAEVASLVERMNGRVALTDADVGYLRVELPLDRLLRVVSSPDVEAYQISTFSKGAWYRDTAPRANAEMFRELETTPIGGQAIDLPNLPDLAVKRARDTGFTGDDELGLGRWFEQHPTFDGRGVTIGLIENAQLDLSHPAFGAAKLAGILNTIDPDDPDDTRVELDRAVRAATTWQIIGNRTYILPRPGDFRFGLFTLPAGANVAHQFAVLEDSATGDTWIDGNGNADFRDETPLVDVSQRVDIRHLKLRHPRAIDIAFVASPGRRQHVWHVYVGRGDHQTMTASVAAGNKTSDSLAYGVAPRARIVLVRTDTNEYRLRHVVEGYLQAARDPRIDIMAAATGFELVPDTDADFAGLFFTRLIAVWQKPTFQSAGNRQGWIGGVTSLGDVFSVGGTLSPETFAAFYGGGTLGTTIVHPSSAGGPALDGRLKPDFLAPTHRIAAGLSTRSRLVVPRNEPAYQLPPGYQISCCTSASSHFAAGFAALLLSGLRQEALPYSFNRFSYALRMGSRFLKGSPAHQQGNGILNIEASWDFLRSTSELPLITATADIVHPLAGYAAHGTHGSGIFERDGWKAGADGRRELRLRRQSGRRGDVLYRVSWTGNDGTFSAPPSIRLPLDSTVALPVDIKVSSPGAHSALLNLHDATNVIVFRTQATIVASETFDPRSHTLRLTGSVPPLRASTHYIAVPDGFSAVSLDFELLRGSAGVNVIPSHGLFPAYQGHVGPQNGRTFTPGRYSVNLPHPSAGVWTIDVTNTSARRERARELVSLEPVEYVITVRLHRVTMDGTRINDDVMAVEMTNDGSELHEPVVQTSAAAHSTHASRLLENGLPNVFTVDVPQGTSTLSVHARVAGGPSKLELYLYDCSTGECFSHNYTIPAAKTQRLTVRKPAPGRWIAAINAAPLVPGKDAFMLETIVAGPPQRSPIGLPRAPGAQWTVTVVHSADPSAAILAEVIDGRTERDNLEYPWEIRENFPKLPHNPIAAGSIVVPIR